MANAPQDIPSTPSSCRWTRADWLCVALIAALLAAFHLVNAFDRPLTAAHEAKAGLIARKMLDERAWFVGEIDMARINKPPLYYWCVAGLGKLFGGVNAAAVRLPGMLAAWAAVLVTFVFARNLFDRWSGLAAAIALASTAQFWDMGRSATLDSFVALPFILALFCFWKALSAPHGAWSRGGWAWSFGAWLALAFGVAAKGPLVAAMTGAVIVAFLIVRKLTGEGQLLRDAARCHPVTGLLLLLAITVPIYIAQDRASGGRFIEYFLLRENLARAGLDVAGAEPFRRDYPVWYYLATLWVNAAPWCVFLPAAFVPCLRRGGRDGRVRAAALLPVLAFIVPFAMLSMATIKKWPYMMPLMPAAAMMIGHLWAELARGRLADSRGTRRLLYFAATVGLMVALAVAGGLVWMLRPGWMASLMGPEGLIHLRRPVRMPDEMTALAACGPAIVAFCFALPALLVTGVGLLIARRYRGMLACAFLGAVFSFAVYITFIEPPKTAWQSQQNFAVLVNHWRSIPEPKAPLTVCAGEPYELLLHLKGRVRVIRPDHAAAFLACVRPAGSAEEGELTPVIFGRKAFRAVNRGVGPIEPVIETGPDESRDSPLVLAWVKLLAPKP